MEDIENEKWFNKFRIHSKFTIVFLVMIAITGAVGTTGFTGLNRVRRTLDEMVGIAAHTDTLAKQIKIAMLSARRAEKDNMPRYKDLGFEESRSGYVSTVEE